MTKCVRLINEYCNMASVNVTVNMPPEMLDNIDDAVEGCERSRAQYIRDAIREAPSTPCEPVDDVDADENATAPEGAA